MTMKLPTVAIVNSIPPLPGTSATIKLSLQSTRPLLDEILQHSQLSPPTYKSITEVRNVLNKPNEKPIKLIKSNRGSKLETFPVIACVSYDAIDNSFGNIGVIVEILNINLSTQNCVLTIRGKERIGFDGSLKMVSNYNVNVEYIGSHSYEIVKINDNVNTDGVVESLLENLQLIKSYVNDFTKVDKPQFKSILQKLNPLSEIMYIQLSDSSKLLQFQNFEEDLNKSLNTTLLLKYCDLYVTLFPFTYKQQFNYLNCTENSSRIENFKQLLSFVHVLFTKHLNIELVYESWTRLGRLNNGQYLQSKFIVNQFRALRDLLELVDPGSTKDKRISTTNSTNKRSNIFNTSHTNNIHNNKNDLIDDDEEEEEDDELKSIKDFISKLDTIHISKDGKTLLIKDYKRLKKMQKTTADYQQLHNYFDIVMDLPWESVEQSKSKNNIDLEKAQKILNNDHYGMDSVKERILEHIAILKLTQQSENPKPNSKAPILLLNGPPGVGKTSLAKSVAESLNCEFQRVSLGGINDFADIKGHRRTYVGSFPGLIIQSLRKSKSMKLVILLDEIDSISNSNNLKGNPEAALLELLDPEQNHNFTDHYIGFPIDLSNIIFIGTCNDQWRLSEPLRDRMEILDLDGYSYKEKVMIGKKYILPRQIIRNELKKDQVLINDKVLEQIAVMYTHEAGIRNFERLIGKICRKKAVELLIEKNGKYCSTVTKSDLIKYLGVPISFTDSEKYSSTNSLIQDDFGMVHGLSYNTDGSGSLLRFEMVGVPGNQNISCTGSLGSVLLESCEIAETLVEHLIQTHLFIGYDSKKLIDKLKNTNVHMHVPEGSIKKDGPSAGLTMTLCYLSLILEKPVSNEIAMTGEITLTAKALPIGGLKEKLLGASLSGKITKVIVPRLNRNDLIKVFVESIPDRLESKILLTKLVLDEEQCLLNKNKRYKFDKIVENWVKEEYGVEIKYVDDFMGVIEHAWNSEIQLVRKESRAHL